MLNAAGDKSFVDDLVASGYCKCESSLCCYEALRFIPRFYDLFFLVLKVEIKKKPVPMRVQKNPADSPRYFHDYPASSANGGLSKCCSEEESLKVHQSLSPSEKLLQPLPERKNPEKFRDPYSCSGLLRPLPERRNPEKFRDPYSC